ncbi:MAG TPA: OB-fold nucleic acid binding domain-containing protein, partial [Candidatus Limnocylindrales bacterium]|nr:OB-fold nucleic acid binding domain-containing protein [Candidatus Limnocylindrales bacterium]
LAAAPTATPSAVSPRASGRPAPSVVPIATALRTSDRDVAIEAVVTAGAGLLDSSGRRIVVQDASGAIEILLPKDAAAPTVGARVRVIGRVGTAYGAPRLRGGSIQRKGSGSIPAPLRIQGPATASHAWRLITVTGRVDSVRKLGERWRAELAVGAATLVVVGQPGAKIPNTTLIEGRIAEVVGIVRPAYPTASDKRPSILPRSTADVHVTGGAVTASRAPATSVSKGAVSPSTMVAGAAVPAVDADLVDLATLVGSTVRVGGLVLDLSTDGFTLDDGTATGRIVLAGAAADLLGLVEPGDAINAIGRVGELTDAGRSVVVDDPADLVLASALGDLSEPGPASPTPADVAETPADARIAAFADPTGAVPGAGAGIAGLLAIGAASLAVTIIRRRHGRRLLAARVATRLARLHRMPGATHGDRTAAQGSASVD